MRRLIFVLALILISARSFAQTFNWQEMSKPYFVFDTKGISVGWDDNTQYSYLIAPDLTNTKVHCTLTTGAENWPDVSRRVVRTGARRVSACRTDGRYAAAIVPWESGSEPYQSGNFVFDFGRVFIGHIESFLFGYL